MGRVYASEYSVHSLATHLKSLKEVQEFARCVMDDPLWEILWTVNNPGCASCPKSVRFSKITKRRWSRSVCDVYCGVIRLAHDWGLNKLVVLHEMTHLLIFGQEKAWHGREFTGTYLALINRHLGVGPYTVLVRNYKRNEVDVDPAPIMAMIKLKQDAPYSERMAATTKGTENG